MGEIVVISRDFMGLRLGHEFAFTSEFYLFVQ